MIFTFQRTIDLCVLWISHCIRLACVRISYHRSGCIVKEHLPGVVAVETVNVFTVDCVIEDEVAGKHILSY